MTDCTTCIYKNDRCFCPPDKKCTAYKKEKQFVRHTYEFKTSDEWQPGSGACWGECPFSINIKLGEKCKFMDKNYDGKCPFLISMIK